MSNHYDDNADLRFYLERGIDWEPIVRVTEHDFKAPDAPESVAEAVEFYADVLSLVGGFAADEITAHAAELDKAKPTLVDGKVVTHPRMQQLEDAMAELDLNGLTLPRELGGMNAPMLVWHMTTELFARADVSVCAHQGFHGGIAMAALSFSVLEGSTVFSIDPPQITETRYADVVADILENNEWGCMDITEPDAGSDMAKLRCKGELDADGVWRVSGTKIFITSGHGKYHFVIARSEPDEGATAGLKGLSMFLVDAFERVDGEVVRTHTSIDGVEEKLGHHGSATCAIRFIESPARLIGKRGEGFKWMLLLMNNARVGVGFEALGLCEAASQMAHKYAAERESMGKTIDQHEMIAEMLEEMRTDIQGIRALVMAAGWHEELAQKLDIRITNFPAGGEEREALERTAKRHKRRARHLTPLLKYYAAEAAVRIARNNMQIHGGSGYTTDYGAERLLRDALVMPVYEGTSQIQALMAMKDNLMGVVKDPARFVRKLAKARWRSVSARDAHTRRVAGLEAQTLSTLRGLLVKVAGEKIFDLRKHSPSEWNDFMSDWDPKKDFRHAMLHAERLTQMFTDVAVATELHAQARKHADREEVLERWLDAAEPRVRANADRIANTGAGLLARLRANQEQAVAAK